MENFIKALSISLLVSGSFQIQAADDKNSQTPLGNTLPIFGEHQDLFADIWDNVLAVVTPLEQENLELRQQLTTIPDPLLRTQNPSSHLLEQERLPLNSANFVEQIFGDLRKRFTDIITPLEQERLELKKLLAEQREEQIRENSALTQRLASSGREYRPQVQYQHENFPKFVEPAHKSQASEPNLAESELTTSARKLPPLSQHDIEATFGESMEHSLKAKNSFAAMHSEGDTWPDTRLQEIFMEGLFRHYTYTLTGFHYTDNNCLYENLLLNPSAYPISRWHAKTLEELHTKHGLPQLKWGPIPTWTESVNQMLQHHRSKKELPVIHYPSEEDIKYSLTISRWFKAVADALMKNEPFRKLGGDFQRHKVIVEKLEKALPTSKASAEQKKLEESNLYKADRLETDRQVLLFNWMKDAYATASTALRDSLAIDNCIPTEAHPLLEELKTFYPNYLFWAAYQPLVQIPHKKV